MNNGEAKTEEDTDGRRNRETFVCAAVKTDSPYHETICIILKSNSAKCKRVKENWFSSSHLFEFLDLGLLKHGKYIGVGSLC